MTDHLISNNIQDLGNKFQDFNTNYQYSDPNDPNKVWLEMIFRKYYFNNFANIEIDDLIQQHEFGFRLFDGRVHRHLSFKNKHELYAYIIKFSPSDVYCSSSTYINPEAPIDQKKWKGSYLIFDIDGKDLKMECAFTHNFVKCKNCQHLTKGIRSKCDACNSSQMNVIDKPCNQCIRLLKIEVKKLKDILNEDFGIDYKHILVYFSGNNGFHIHVIDDEYFLSSSKKRHAYAQYLLGRGITLEELGWRKNSEGKMVPLVNEIFLNKGWKKRIFKSLKLNISNSKIDDKFIKKFQQIQKTSNSNLQDLIINEIERLSIKIDPNVTMDIHRIFRLAGSINSKSGLIKMFCNNLDNFDPFKESSFIDNKTIVSIMSNVEDIITFNTKKYNLIKGFNEVPENVAVYLISKGLASIVSTGK